MNSTTAGSASNKCLDAEVGIAVCPRAAVELAKAPFLGSPAWSGPRAPPNGWSPKPTNAEAGVVVCPRAAVVLAKVCHLQVHFDGWSQQFDFWSDSDHLDLHPVGWSQCTGHLLEPPPGSSPTSPSQGGCPTRGCRGVGHIKGAKYSGHHSAFGCPYSDINMRKEVLLPDRLGGERVITLVPVSMYHHGNQSLRLPRPSQPTKFLCVKQEEEELHITPETDDEVAVSMETARHDNCAVGCDGLRALGSRDACLTAQWAAESLHQSVFLSAMSPQPGRDLSHSDLSHSLCWEQQRKLLPGVWGVQAETVQHWSAQQVSDFIESLPGCEEQAKQFRDEQIDGRAFLLLSQRDIVRIMSIKLGPALKIYNSILIFRHAQDQSQSDAQDQSQSDAQDQSQSDAQDQSQSDAQDQSHQTL
ncbi:lethal(3)malignant brain tumor-like protein 1 [Pseudoliparis swirei]|uniref:lethal(3)malignant brain tumor-like protein 1 n=1 Tax=Pseudoliparis swirei TaxID=2059687 RepID=UPI0024BE21BD|nr:lethal(3)malignant brain tumor-like protein 1 [Pseudoliparis swirei]